MKILTILLLIIESFFLMSCSVIGTKTLYKTDQVNPIHIIGFNNPDIDRRLSNIFPKTLLKFNESIVNTLKDYGIYDSRNFNIDISFDNPDVNRIIELCYAQDMDAFIITRLKFIHVIYTVDFALYAQNYDTEVEMKLFDKNGRLLVSTSHNTLKGNSYLNIPLPDRTVYDGTRGALKRALKEIGLKK